MRLRSLFEPLPSALKTREHFFSAVRINRYGSWPHYRQFRPVKRFTYRCPKLHTPPPVAFKASRASVVKCKIFHEIQLLPLCPQERQIVVPVRSGKLIWSLRRMPCAAPCACHSSDTNPGHSPANDTGQTFNQSAPECPDLLSL